MNRLVDKVAVITGGGSGIGRASAKMFVAEGAKVVVAEIDEAMGEASAREAGTGARFMRTDVTDEGSVKQMVGQVREAFGRIDVLLNCAGGSLREDRPVTEVDLSVWDHTMNLDLRGPFLCCRHVVPVMIEQGKGSVVNFSSVVALRGNHIAHVYVMAKGGLISFTRALAGAYSPKGIRVNAICPGIVLTERVKSRFSGGNQIRFGGIGALGSNSEEDDRRFATVATVFEINHGLYYTLARPMVQVRRRARRINSSNPTSASVLPHEITQP